MSTLIRPYSETDVPPELDGSQGTNRAPLDRRQVPLENDREAIGYFLEQYTGSESTHRAYSKECERLALYALHQKQKAVSSFSVLDVEDYIGFLADPQPSAMWCGIKVARAKQEWRPFVGPLDVKGRLAALSAINSMLNYWVQVGYINGNPLGLFRQLKQKILDGKTASQDGKGIKARKRAQAAVVAAEGTEKVERFLDDEMKAAAIQAVENMSLLEGEVAQAEYERARFILAFLFLLAPRVGELELHSMNSFKEVKGNWWWEVVGKGRKKAKVPVPDDMRDALIRYRKFLGLTALPTRSDDSPLLRSVRHPGEGITARRLNQILKEIFKAAGLLLPEGSEFKAEKLAMASAHWGRHTSITDKVEAGMDHRFVQQDARHADFRTTEHYIHDDDKDRHDDAQKLKLKWSGSPQVHLPEGSAE